MMELTGSLVGCVGLNVMDELIGSLVGCVSLVG